VTELFIRKELPEVDPSIVEGFWNLAQVFERFLQSIAAAALSLPLIELRSNEGSPQCGID